MKAWLVIVLAVRTPWDWREGFAPPTWSNWVLALIGIGAVVAAFRTLRTVQTQTEATRIAAEATEKSVRLQEIIQQQWIQVDGWRREGGGSREESPPRFTIAMDISNPTDIPLTVETVSMSIGSMTIAFTVGNVLAPGAPGVKADFPIILKPEQIAHYDTYSLVLVVTGFVTYVDAFGNRETQPFNQGCICGRDNFFRSSPLQIVDRRQEKQGRNPS